MTFAPQFALIARPSLRYPLERAVNQTFPNVDGTSFAQNSRRIIFNAATDLPITQLPKANEVRCTVVSDPTRSREFETIWEERTSGVELRGLIDAPPGGRWTPGNYTFSCQTGAEPFLTWRFEVE